MHILGEALMRPESLPPLVGALVELGVGAALLASAERRTRTWFVLMALFSGLWGLCSALLLGLPANERALAHTLARLSLGAISVIGACYLRFATLLARVESSVARVLLGLSVAIALVIVAVPWFSSAFARPTGGFWPAPSPASFLAMLATVPTSVLGIYYLWRGFGSLQPSRRRRQLGWALAAFLIGLGGVLDMRAGLKGAYPVGWATSSLSTITLLYALAQPRLVAARTFVVQVALGIAGAIGGAAVVYLAAGLVPDGWLHRAFPFAISTVVLFMLMRAWVSSAEPWLGRYLARRARRMERAMADFERQALDARSTNEVREALAEALESGFGAELCALHTEERDGELPLVREVSSALRRVPHSLLRDLLDLETPEEAQLVKLLNELSADAIVPLRREGELVGFAAAYGPVLRAADDRLAEELGHLGERAARAWVNARLYDEVARRQKGLEAQVRLRTSELEGALGELKTAQAKLVDAERSSSLGLLVAGISHEINNALNFISANLPTLARYTAAAEARLDSAQVKDDMLTQARNELPGTVQRLEGATRRAVAIVADLRRFARPDAERRLIRPEEGIEAALNLLRRRTEGRIEVTRVCVGTPSLEGYPGPLNQCFFNLLLNAVEAAASEIWVLVQERGERGGIEVIIRDDGAGISADVLEQVFQPFFSTKPRHAGLGLTVSKGIIERHGGTLTLDSQPGEGTSVRVRLPSRAPEPQQRRVEERQAS